ncbi:MAG: hypothetical protein U9O18_07895 [Chloroflexota bacterium]|nr:hypothetical protein [Chloroflexota bacterium]
MDTLSLLRQGTLDAELAALLWLLVEGNVPVVVAGSADATTRTALAAALLGTDPGRRWVVLDAGEEPVTADRLAALLRGGVGLGVSVEADDLEAVLDRLTSAGLPQDGVRRLGVVLIAEETEAGLRCAVVHYLRPTERDAQGHIQRRPPAVLAAWDEQGDVYEHYAWGITPELADRVDRSQADLEERQHERAAFLAAAAADDATPEEQRARIERYLAADPDPHVH